MNTINAKSVSPLFVLVLAAVISNTAAADTNNSANLSDLLDNTNASEVENCLYAREIRSVEVLDERGLVIRGSHDRYWVNEFAHKCAGLQKNMVLNFKRYGSQVCANDRVSAQDRVFDGFGPLTSCRLGKFQPVAMEQVVTLKAELAGGQ